MTTFSMQSGEMIKLLYYPVMGCNGVCECMCVHVCVCGGGGGGTTGNPYDSLKTLDKNRLFISSPFLVYLDIENHQQKCFV